jgi:hypothetical protein
MDRKGVEITGGSSTSKNVLGTLLLALVLGGSVLCFVFSFFLGRGDIGLTILAISLVVGVGGIVAIMPRAFGEALARLRGTISPKK